MPAWIAAGTLLLASATTWPARAQAVSVYRGLCDASAAVALDADHFVVASDEDNVLRVYRRGQADAVARVPLADFLGSADSESDIEGAASMGTRTYWISSHGRNKNGKLREARYRFFATEVDTGPVPPTVTPVATPYRRLLADLLSAPTLQRFKLAEAARLAPEAPGGLNIEGLAVTAAGGLLLGFRNPVPNGKALLVELENPAEVLAGQAARLGEPVLLNLRGRGVRSIERVGDEYLIVAGPSADSGPFSLYHWRGRAGDAPRLATGADLSGLRPEALFAIPGTSSVQLLSDDGGVVSDGVACKDRPAAEQSFRSLVVTPSAR